MTPNKMVNQMHPNRLRYVLVFFGIVLIMVAALHVVLGPNTEVLLGSAISQNLLSDPTLDSQNRFYGAALALYGILLVYCSFDIPRYRTILNITIGVFFLAGLARSVSVIVVGWPSTPVMVLFFMELVFPPILIVWLRKV